MAAAWRLLPTGQAGTTTSAVSEDAPTTATVPGHLAWPAPGVLHSCAAAGPAPQTGPLPLVGRRGRCQGGNQPHETIRHPGPLRAELVAPPQTSRACHATRNPSSDQLTEAPYMSRCRRVLPRTLGWGRHRTAGRRRLGSGAVGGCRRW